MFKQYIGGKVVDGNGEKKPIYDPATGEIIDYVSCADKAQAEEALNAANDAFKTWSKTSAQSSRPLN